MRDQLARLQADQQKRVQAAADARQLALVVRIQRHRRRSENDRKLQEQLQELQELAYGAQAAADDGNALLEAFEAEVRHRRSHTTRAYLLTHSLRHR